VAADLDFVVEDGGAIATDELLGVLADGYGHPFTTEWFDWKHCRGAWGPSRRIVARDADGLLGVVFAMPWRYRTSVGELEEIRLVDATTTRRAIRRGVFRRMVREFVAPSDGSPMPQIVLATATPEAQAGNVKNGAVALEPIAFAYRPTAWSGAALVMGDSVIDGLRRDPPAGTISTAWTPAGLRWRLDPASGGDYGLARLADADHANGLVHRTVTRRGARVLVVTTVWGSPAEQRTLVRAAARRQRAVAVLSPVGPGTPHALPKLALRRGRSLLCVWDRRTRPADDISTRAAWCLDGLDLEGFL
jgi:hypothetical protein